MKTIPLATYTLLISALAFSGCKSTEKPIAGDRARATSDLERSVGYLASDELEGRGLQTHGLDLAADYIEKSFRDAKLKKLTALPTYRQPFEVSNAPTTGPSNRLTLEGTELQPGVDFIPLGMSGSGPIDAPIIFAGYGIDAPDLGRNDYDGIDATGKAVMVFRYEPPKFAERASAATRLSTMPTSIPTSQPQAAPAKGVTAYASFAAKIETAIRHGAAAVIIVQPPSRKADESLISLARSAGEASTIPVVQITSAAADKLLAGRSSAPLTDYEAAANLGPTGYTQETGRLVGNIDLQRVPRRTANIIAMLPGKGEHKGDIIVVGAHYDHVGLGERGAVGSFAGQIHHGADDNASGTAALIEAARTLAAMGPQERTVVFVAFSGEERGLLGSAHFVDHPPVDLANVVAMLNLDMVGRVRDKVVFVGGTGTSESFPRLMREVDYRSVLKFKTVDGNFGGKGGVGPSDHASFARKQIPVLFLFSGMEADYHRPTDTADKINYPGIADVVEATVDTVQQLCRIPRSTYIATFDRGGARGGSRAQLGIMPDYDNTTGGVKLAGTMPETAAAAAGLKEGDAIVGWGNKSIVDMNDLSESLSTAKPGDQVTLKIRRDGKAIDVPVTLKERKE